MSSSTEIRNWSGNVRFSAAHVHQPTSIDAVRHVVGAAHDAGSRVHACGSRHSFSTVADSDGELISTTGLNRLVSIDREAMVATVEAGIRYGELSAELHRQELALHNLPSLPHITVGGAVSTATHGSGAGNGNLATAVRAVELVIADGSVVRIADDDDRFGGVVVALGGAGVAVRFELAIEPTFEVAQTVYRDLSFETGVSHLDEIMDGAYSVSLFTDYQRNVFQQVWWKRRVDTDGEAPRSLLGALPATVALHPVESVSAESCTPQLGEPGPWADRLAHFRLEFTPSSGDELQSEYFVPRHHGAEALRAVAELASLLGPILKVSEVRTVAADDVWLSGAYAADTLALHFTWISDVSQVMAVLPRLEAALDRFDARPHWGKLTTMSADTIRSRYARWNDFERVLVELDPSGTFRNPYIDALGR